jgi:hypothetical protein
VTVAIVATLASAGTALASPSLQLERTIRTSPFVGSSVSIKDGEGTADIVRDHSLWLVDDNGRAIHEVDPSTGALKRTIGRADFEAAPRLGGGPAAGPNRSGDLESAAYDAAADELFIFSGPCCTSSNLPTAFRLTRDGSGDLQVESHQPLASGSNHTASAWNPGDHEIYVGQGTVLRTYDYATNTLGPTFRVTGLSGILGLDFSTRDGDLFVVTSAERLIRVDWASRTIVPGWSFDLAPSGVRDSRGVSVILGSSASDDRYYVLDGGDTRSSGDPLRHAVYVFKVLDGGSPPPPTGNLVGNPGFETDLAGWSADGSGTGVTLTRAASGHTGSSSAHVVNGSTGTRKCVLNDTPNWVATTQPGTYTASLWVRGDVAGSTIKITLKEMNGGTQVRSRIFSATLETTWNLIAVTETTASPGSTLDLQVFIPKAQAPPGTCFYADDVSITLS